MNPDNNLESTCILEHGFYLETPLARGRVRVDEDTNLILKLPRGMVSREEIYC
jgi:hypothetical protein